MQALGSIVLETFNFKEDWIIDDLFAAKNQVRHIKKKVSLVQKQEFIKYLNVKLHYISLQRSSQDIYIYFLN